MNNSTITIHFVDEIHTLYFWQLKEYSKALISVIVYHTLWKISKVTFHLMQFRKFLLLNLSLKRKRVIT